MNDQSDNRTNFEAWFGSKLTALMSDREAGFVIVMVTFPLLERYLRQKSRGEPSTDKFNRALLQVLPELKDRPSANLFWAIYRHGLLHNVALSKESHGLSHDKPIVEVGPNEKVWLNPNLFAERVLVTIRNDFTTFEQGVVLPQVSPLQPKGDVSVTNTVYYGTSMPPGGHRR